LGPCSLEIATAEDPPGFENPAGLALALLDKRVRADTSIYPPEEVLQKLEAGQPLDAEGQRRREELWKAVRA